MDFNPTFIPPIMLIIVGVGWMLVWAFGRHGDSGNSWSNEGPSENGLLRRRADSKNPSMNPITLSHLARDQDIVVRLRVASNPSTPADVLARLASDSSPGVRSAVAQNLSTLTPLLQVLTSDSHEKVRTAALGNPNTPSEIPNPDSKLKSKVDELTKLADLRDRGVLTEQEFAAEKAKILGT